MSLWQDWVTRRTTETSLGRRVLESLEDDETLRCCGYHDPGLAPAARVDLLFLVRGGRVVRRAQAQAEWTVELGRRWEQSWRRRLSGAGPERR